MSNWFEGLTKTLADETLSRRLALQRIASSAVGGALALWLPEAAFAQTRHNYACNMPGNCNGQPYPNCNPLNANCYCFTELTTGKGKCGCNMYCDGFYGCTNNSQCTKGWFCATQIGCACTSGWCIQYCNKTCRLSTSGSGKTAAMH